MGAVCCRERSATLLVDRDSGQKKTSARATALLEMLVREEPGRVWGRPKSRLLRMHHTLGRNRVPPPASDSSLFGEMACQGSCWKLHGRHGSW